MATCDLPDVVYNTTLLFGAVWGNDFLQFLKCCHLLTSGSLAGFARRYFFLAMSLPYIVHTNLHKEMKTFLDHIYVDVGNREIWAIYGSGHPRIRLLYWDKKVNLEKKNPVLLNVP